ncbi:MAG: SusD/RagB family nutrient-binding outer membrane lipoprotein [Bacteroidales bacterium]
MKIKYIFLAMVVMFTMTSCTYNFEELNKNPNNPATSDVDYIFNYVVKEGAGEYAGSGGGRIYSTYNITYVQRWIMHTAAVYGNSTMPPYTLFDQYRIQNLWRYFYTDLLLNCTVLENMLKDDPALVNKYQAVRIWKAYNFQRVTDLWGDVPYSEAWKILDDYTKESQSPGYDNQEFIYNDLMDILKDAAASFDKDKIFFSNDMLFQGNIDSWVKFANSLRLRMAIRSGDQAVVNEIIAENNLISSNEESALFSYIESQDWWSPYYAMNIGSKNPTNPDNTGTSVPKISELMVRQLRDSNDPRLEIYAQPIEIDNTTITGVPNLMNATLKENQAMGMGVSSSSYIGPFFSDNPTFVNPLLTYTEVCFLRAEAAFRGWSEGDIAEDLYREGVQSALEYFEIADSVIQEFIATGGAFNNTLEQIITQKWISLYLNGWEAFAEYRRTGFPKLHKWDLELDGVKILKANWVEVPRNYLPGRLPYPDDEVDLNYTNYKEASDNQGGDSYYQQVWWSRQFGTIEY